MVDTENHPVTFPDWCNHYVAHFTKHCLRVIHMHQHLGKAAQEIDPFIDAAGHPVLGEVTPKIAERVHVVVDLKKSRDKALLLLLKIEFEIFLNRMLANVWDHFYDHAISVNLKVLQKEKVSLAEVSAGTDAVRELVRRKLIPTQGLKAFVAKFNSVAGMPVVDFCDALGPGIYAQIDTAFQVRHLIEHQNNVVDDRFWNNVKDSWGKSSWSDLPYGSANKVLCREEDFMKTYYSMVLFASAFGMAMQSWRPGAEPGWWRDKVSEFRSIMTIG